MRKITTTLPIRMYPTQKQLFGLPTYTNGRGSFCVRLFGVFISWRDQLGDFAELF